MDSIISSEELAMHFSDYNDEVETFDSLLLTDDATDEKSRIQKVLKAQTGKCMS